MKKIIFFLLLPLTGFSQIDTCNVEFIFNVNNESKQVKFTQKNAEIIVDSFLWDFGDGETSTINEPTHDYDETGSFIVCLTVLTTSGCVGTFCDTVVIESLPQITYNLSGTVFTNFSLLPSGFALLVNRTYNEFTYTEVVRVINGNYHFADIDPGLYLVYVIPVFQITGFYYPVYLPTYSGNSINWQHAVPVHVSSNNTIQNIHLASFSDIITGDRSVRGKITYTNTALYEESIFNTNWNSLTLYFNPEHNASNMSVLLFDIDGNCIKSAQTDSLGEFLFENLPYGKYFISPEKAGVVSQNFPVDIETSSDSLNYYYITLNSTGFVGISENVLILKSLTVFPNPADNYISIPSENKDPFTLFSSMGKQIGTYTGETERVDVSHFVSGCYFIKWQGGGTSVFVKE